MKTRGYSFIELMVGFTIFSLLVVGVTRLMVQNILNQRHQSNQLQARGLAENQLEVSCQAAFSAYQVDRSLDLGVRSVDGVDFHLSLEVSSIAGMPDNRIRRLRVLADWQERRHRYEWQSQREVTAVPR